MNDQPALPLTPPTPLCQFPTKPDGSGLDRCVCGRLPQDFGACPHWKTRLAEFEERDATP
jgi:hypothetical protein